jgi:uncharacterized protein (TIGR00251 family)
VVTRATDTLALRATPAGVRLDIRVTARASKNGIDGVRDGRLVVRVTAPPVDDAANTAVVAVLADAFDVPKRSVRLVTGATSRSKTVEITGCDVSTVRARLR